MRHQLFIIGILWCFPYFLSATPSQKVIFSLENEWSVYDEEKSAYVPFLRPIHRRTNQLHLSPDLKKYAGFYLKIQGQKNAHLFMNNQLSYTFQKSGVVYWNVDSLRQELTHDSDSVCLITYYTLTKISHAPKALIVLTNHDTVKKSELEQKQDVESLQRIRRERHYNNDLRSLMKLVSLIPLVIMILIWQFDKSSALLLSRRKADSFQKTGQLKRISVLSFVGFICYFASTMAFSIWFLNDFSVWITTDHLHPAPENLWEYGMSFLQLFLFFFLFIILKYFIIQFMGMLYRDTQVSMLHTQQYINTAQFFCTLTAIVMCLSNFIIDRMPSLTNSIIFVFCGLVFIKLILMTIQLNKLVSYRKIYLFSYLCATEYILVLLSVKFFTIL